MRRSFTLAMAALSFAALFSATAACSRVYSRHGATATDRAAAIAGWMISAVIFIADSLALVRSRLRHNALVAALALGPLPALLVAAELLTAITGTIANFVRLAFLLGNGVQGKSCCGQQQQHRVSPNDAHWTTISVDHQGGLPSPSNPLGFPHDPIVSASPLLDSDDDEREQRTPLSDDDDNSGESEVIDIESIRAHSPRTSKAKRA